MVIIGGLAEVGGQRGGSALSHGGWQVTGCHDVVENQSHRCCGDGGEQGVGDGMAENLAHVGLVAEGGQGSDYCQGDGGYCQELEQAGVDGGDEVRQTVEPSQSHGSQHGSYYQGAYPECQLAGLLVFAFRSLFHIRFVEIVAKVLLFYEKNAKKRKKETICNDSCWFGKSFVTLQQLLKVKSKRQNDNEQKNETDGTAALCGNGPDEWKGETRL